MKVWVVMSNDFPDSVWSDEARARDYIKVRNSEWTPHQTRIYWTVYEFEVNNG